METLCTVIGVAALVLLLGITVARVFNMWQQRSLFMRYLETCFKEDECTTSTSERERKISWLR